ncbi:AMP-binding protein [Mumia sp. zg.B21]|uniref:AMP-binding protein n=1 Tax=Mumia sp. zg.B21 TaxID=2855447 RepID=UPI001C6E6816|nr:AMP-binding protein [Mumia sp. zg.B21]MBW9211335.1 AMP-binding protein [Mumia sp. zg.B21]
MTNQLRGPGQHPAAASALTLASLATCGVVRPYGPRALVGVGRALARWGTGLAGGYASLAARTPNAVAIHDDLGSITFADLGAQANAFARALSDLGVGEGDGVALMARNHRWFVITAIAVARLGADVLYLNTAFSGPQVRELLEREKPAAIVHDDEFSDVVASAPSDAARVVAWADVPGPGTVGSLVSTRPGTDLPAPRREGRSVILTSGTTGAPKGAARGSGSLSAGAALLSRIPLRARMTVHVAAPLFHTWGWGHLNLAMLLGSTLVLRRRFTPRDFLDTLARTRSDAAVVIPVMLQRALQLPKEELDSYDLSALTIVAASGSSLPGDLATAWMDQYGDNLYNTYGSTECAWVTIAQPAEMRAHPGTAGAPPIATVIALYDTEGRPATGSSGRIFVRNGLPFEGYTHGGGKEVVDGLMSTGDVGTIRDGLLFVEGRDDEMIVSGGENVYPQEVENCLARHPAVLEVAVVGVEDVDFGHRLLAWVALRPGHDVTEDDLKLHVRERLARYKVPREVRFLHELPRNATGKILKRRLTHTDESE